MGKIALEGLEFFAYHGNYEEEQKIGNRYAVDIMIDTDFEEASVEDTLEKTIDYVQLSKIVEEQMQKPSRLLEHVGQQIIDQLFIAFNSISHIKVRISKYNPPIGRICSRAYIEIELDRDQR